MFLQMTNLKNKKAFSLIELSIVLLIIGIIIAGVTQSSRLIRQFKITTARNQTTSGPVSSIKDLGAWYETTLEESLIDLEAQDSAIAVSTVSTWKDINTASATKYNATQTDTTFSPYYYSNCISGLPCLRFDGTNDRLDFDGSVLVGSDYTIFVVEQRRAPVANFFLGSIVQAPAANTLLELGYTADTTIKFGEGDTNNFYTIGTTPAISSYTTPSPRLHVFVNASIASGTAGTVYHYMNGSATPSSLATPGGGATLNTLTTYSSAAIGISNQGGTKYSFNGDIGEIIFYRRALKNEERVAVEDYLLKKWAIAGL